MTTKQIDNFDPAYRDRIRDAVWNAILEASRDPTTNMAALRNCEIYDALLQLQAIILASSKQAGSAAEMRVIGAQFGRRLRRLVAEFKRRTIVMGHPSPCPIPMSKPPLPFGAMPFHVGMSPFESPLLGHADIAQDVVAKGI